MYNIFGCAVCGQCIAPDAEIAQLVEHFTRNEGVVGSSPIFSFLFYVKCRLMRHFFTYTNNALKPFFTVLFQLTDSLI